MKLRTARLAGWLLHLWPPFRERWRKLQRDMHDMIRED